MISADFVLDSLEIGIVNFQQSSDSKGEKLEKILILCISITLLGMHIYVILISMWNFASPEHIYQQFQCIPDAETNSV